jgi:hypothetical protein
MVIVTVSVQGPARNSAARLGSAMCAFSSDIGLSALFD